MGAIRLTPDPSLSKRGDQTDGERLIINSSFASMLISFNSKPRRGMIRVASQFIGWLPLSNAYGINPFKRSAQRDA